MPIVVLVTGRISKFYTVLQLALSPLNPVPFKDQLHIAMKDINNSKEINNNKTMSNTTTRCEIIPGAQLRHFNNRGV